MRSKLIRSITALFLVIAMAVGMAASLGGNAQAASDITITFYANGGYCTTNGQQKVEKTIKSGSSLTLLTTFARPGYSLSEWQIKGKNSKYGRNQNVTFTSSTELVAVWVPNKITITYNLNGGTWKSGSTSQSYTYGNKYTLNPPQGTKTGYTIKGWNTKSDGSGTMYQSGQTNTMFSQNTTLYAIWTGISAKITYNTNGGTVGTVGSNGMTQPFSVGKSVTLNPPSIYRTGYTLQGFSTDKNDTSAPYKKGKSYNFNMNTTLYAIWKKDAIQVVFDGNQGTFTKDGKSCSTITVTGSDGYVRAIPSEIPRRPGYKFLGYSTSKTATSAKYGRSGAISISASQTVYAVWVPLVVHEASRVAGLSRRDFVQVQEGNEWKFGADQNFADYYESQTVIDALAGHILITESQAKKYLAKATCGTFAAINTVKYLQGSKVSTSVSIILALEKYYDGFGLDYFGDLPRIIKFNGEYIGETPDCARNYIEDNYKCSTDWKGVSNKNTLISDFKKMLWTDVPVIMFFTGGGNLDMKKVENNDYKNFHYCSSHYFVVTAMYVNSDDPNDIWLELASGETVREYVSLNEYYEKKSNGLFAGSFGNGYILITPKGGLRSSAPTHTSSGGHTHSGAGGHF